jgi:hypothetical protein
MEKKSPKTFLNDHVYSKVPKVTKKRKAKDDEKIPSFNEHDNFLHTNYRVNQLKSICNHYKLKKSGNKDELIYNIYNFLKFSLYSLKIQRLFRGHIIRRINYWKGPALFKRSECVNENDFYTFEPLNEISYSQFFSFSDSDGFMYGFDIKSLFHLISIDKEKALNPYNRNKLPDNIIPLFKQIKKLSKKILNIDIDLKMVNEDELSEEKKYELRIIEVFQKINSLGNYSDSSWFTQLNRQQCTIFIRELLDIWTYRAQLTHQSQREICPPNGNPFYNVNFHYINTWEFKELQQYSLKIIENLVNCGINNEAKSLGAYYVLASLTLVNENARNSLPWLYQSVAHN